MKHPLTTTEQLLFTTVRIEAEYADGAGGGTAFLYGLEDGEESYTFVVTNKHVVAGAKHGRFLLTKKNGDGPDIGNACEVGIPDFDREWFGHPNADVDIAVMPFAPIVAELRRSGVEVYYRTLGADMVPMESELENFDAINDVTFIGYPNGLYDTKNLTPIIRRGVTATPLTLDYCGEQTFLIDASVFPGSSGSPVFIWDRGTYADRTGINIGSRRHFVGVLSSVLVQPDSGTLELSEIPTASVPVVKLRQLMDLGLVHKAVVVQDTIAQFMIQWRRAQHA